jgi:hypothetical protein
MTTQTFRTRKSQPHLSGAFVNSDPSDEVTLSIIPLAAGVETDAAATSEKLFFLPLSTSTLSGAAGAGENIAVNGDPNLNMTDLNEKLIKMV